MSTMDNLCYQTNKMIVDLQFSFERLEKSYGSQADAIEQDIEQKLAQILSNCDRLDTLLFREPVGRRQSAKLKVDQAKYDLKHQQAALRLYQHKKMQKLQEEQSREELLTRRFTTLANEDTSINIDMSLQHHTSLQNAHRGMDELLSSGSTILDSLRDQRGVLKGAKTRLLNVAGTLGLSNTTMKYIEKRVSQDRIILFAGMIITIIIIILTFKYLT